MGEVLPLSTCWSRHPPDIRISQVSARGIGRSAPPTSAPAGRTPQSPGAATATRSPAPGRAPASVRGHLSRPEVSLDLPHHKTVSATLGILGHPNPAKPAPTLQCRSSRFPYVRTITVCYYRYYYHYYDHYFIYIYILCI